jgi:hypothetical protein
LRDRSCTRARKRGAGRGAEQMQGSTFSKSLAHKRSARWDDLSAVPEEGELRKGARREKGGLTKKKAFAATVYKNVTHQTPLLLVTKLTTNVRMIPTNL